MGPIGTTGTGSPAPLAYDSLGPTASSGAISIHQARTRCWSCMAAPNQPIHADSPAMISPPMTGLARFGVRYTRECDVVAPLRPRLLRRCRFRRRKPAMMSHSRWVSNNNAAVAVGDRPLPRVRTNPRKRREPPRREALDCGGLFAEPSDQGNCAPTVGGDPIDGRAKSHRWARACGTSRGWMTSGGGSLPI